MSKLQDQFENEFGYNVWHVKDPFKYKAEYVEWLEQRLESRQHETVAIGLPTDDEVLNA